jgi:uncharacterized SAM-binding protein YcdF (DUF218 family)
MYQTLLHLFDPYTVCCLLLAVSLVLLWRKRRDIRGRVWLVTVPAVGMIVMSFPWVGHLGLASLEWQFDRLEERPANTQAIVVLAGQILWPNALRRQAELGMNTTMRCIEAARLYHQGRPLPMVVSGGQQYGGANGPSAAAVMRDFLVKMGVKAGDVILEDSSQTTYENAVECRQLLERRHIDRIVLVTEAIHMRRAYGCFRKQGFEVVPSPCRFNATEFNWDINWFLPDARSPQTCKRVFHEWLGVIWYSVKGRS